MYGHLVPTLIAVMLGLSQTAKQLKNSDPQIKSTKFYMYSNTGVCFAAITVDAGRLITYVYMYVHYD